MATKAETTVAYLPGDSEEARRANEQYQEALAKLTASLDQRKNRFFDPVWLAAAQGFLAPGAPDFFESLGRVAGNISQAQDRVAKEDQDIAAQKLAVAGQNVELQRLKARDAELARYLSGGEPAGGATPGGALPGRPGAAPAGALPVAQGAPSGAPEGAPAGALSRASGDAQAAPDVFGIQIAAPDKSLLTGRQYIALNRFDKSKSQADLLREANEIDRKNTEVKEGGVFNRATGMWQPAPTGKTETIQIYGYPGTYTVDAATAATLAHLARNDDPRYHDLAKRIISGPQRATPAADGKETGRLKSEAERDVEKIRREERAKAQAKIETETLAEINQRAKDSDETILTANIFRRFADEPNAKKMVGILNNPKISSAIAMLAKEGIGIPGFTSGTKAVEDIMRNAGLTPQEQAQYRTVMMLMAQTKLLQSKYMKGSVSDFEQKLIANASITDQDTPETIRMKADLLTRRGQFDKRVSRAFKDSGMNADEFVQSETYDKMYEKHIDDMTNIALGLVRLNPALAGTLFPNERSGSQRQAPAAPAQGAGSARQNLDRLLQQGRQ